MNQIGLILTQTVTGTESVSQKGGQICQIPSNFTTKIKLAFSNDCQEFLM